VFVSDLDAPLLRLSAHDTLSLRDACAGGIHAFGQSGSGKTSALGKMLAGAFLRAGMGGCVTCVKFEEVDLWRRYVREHGRESSLVVFDESEGFNFLAYEIARQGMAGIGSVVECLMQVLEAAKRVSPTASPRGGDPFWSDSARQVLRHCIPPLYSAIGSLSVGDITRFVNTAPASVEDVTDKEWHKRSFMYGVMNAAANHPKVPMERAALEDAINYWAEEYPAIPDKVRGSIAITVTAALDRFKHGRLARAFCSKTSIVPEMSFHGAVILLAMPTLTWNEDGIIGQQLFKYAWERSVLGRNSLEEKHRERPLFLFSDEAQETATPYDGEPFLSLCRASKCCTVFMSQSLPNYYAKIGTDNPRDAAHALVGKFGTHVFFSNACPETNEYAAKMIGRVMTRRANYSAGSNVSVNQGMSAGESRNGGWSSNLGYSTAGHGGGGGSRSGGFSGSSNSGNNWGSNRGRSSGESESRGYHEGMEYAIEPGDFARTLKTGGKANGGLVTGVWFQAGRVFRAEVPF
jgi:TraM recognition site of TraD and TraG